MRLPTEIMAEILRIIGNKHHIKDIFAARGVNKLFRHELTKRLVRNTRLEDEYFLTHIGDAGEVRDAWSTCPKSLRMAYFHHKFEQHNVHACPFSYRIDELLDYHATLDGKTETRGQVLEKLFHGVLEISYPDCMVFMGEQNDCSDTESDVYRDQPAKESYEALLAISAIKRGNEAEFARMIEMGVDPMLKCDTFKLAPLLIVAKHGTAKMASAIIDHPRSRTLSGQKNMNAAFQVSVAKAKKAVIDVWLSAMRRDLDYKDYPLSCLTTELCRLAVHANINMLVFLLGRCTSYELRARYVALDVAIRAQHVDVVDCLVKYPGFSPKQANKLCPRHILRVAMRCHHRETRDEIIRILLDAGLDEDVTVRPSTKAETVGDELLASLPRVGSRLVSDEQMSGGDLYDGSAGLDEYTDDEDSEDESEEEQDDQAFMVMNLSQLYRP
ncbi:hypothetical protein BDV19DRAFT_390687 [Aspergillus venezuelensis]